MRITSINIAVFVIVPFAIWLGYTGRVDWWVIGFVAATHFSIDLKLRG
jgi:hypothetical protein